MILIIIIAFTVGAVIAIIQFLIELKADAALKKEVERSAKAFKDFDEERIKALATILKTRAIINKKGNSDI